MSKKNNDTKQLEILRYIYDTVERRGFPPTVREICAAVKLSSTSTVHGHLARLERKGLLIKTKQTIGIIIPNKSRQV